MVRATQIGQLIARELAPRSGKDKTLRCGNHKPDLFVLGVYMYLYNIIIQQCHYLHHRTPMWVKCKQNHLALRSPAPSLSQTSYANVGQISRPSAAQQGATMFPKQCKRSFDNGLRSSSSHKCIGIWFQWLKLACKCSAKGFVTIPCGLHPTNTFVKIVKSATGLKQVVSRLRSQQKHPVTASLDKLN